MDQARIDRETAGLLALLGTGRQRTSRPAFDMAEAYAISARILALREARGETPVGRKIGFTNTTIWDRYGVDGPMWNWVFDDTLHCADAGVATLSLAGMPEPRVEPEVVLGLDAAPEPGMDETALLGCLGWVAHGFELVQSVYPDWRMTGAEAAAAFGLHGALVVGPRRPVAHDRSRWGAALASFTVTLFRDGAPCDRGAARNVLGGPLSALRFLVDEIARRPGAPPLRPGEIITTGTLTDAWPGAPGETWTARFDGIDLPAITLDLARD